MNKELEDLVKLAISLLDQLGHYAYGQEYSSKTSKQQLAKDAHRYADELRKRLRKLKGPC